MEGFCIYTVGNFVMGGGVGWGSKKQMFVNSVFQKGNFWQNNADNKVFFSPGLGW